jgi:hypothetical protein
LILIHFGVNKNLGQFETMIRNATLSSDLAPIFKMLKTWGIKTPHWLMLNVAQLAWRLISHWATHKNSYDG